MRIAVDSSHWNAIDWSKFKPEMLIQKATESTNYFDPTYTKNRDEAKKRGIPFGAYHFARSGDPVKEATYFLSKTGEVDFYALDAETGQTMAWCKTFCDHIAKAGKKVILYAPMGVITDIGYAKWIPRYKYAGGDSRDDGKPDMAYQPTKKWDIWQFTSNGVIPGVTGRVDLNLITDELFATLTSNVEESMQKEFVEAIEKLLEEEYGDNLNEKEQKDAANELIEVKAKLDWGNQLELTNVRLLANNEELAKKLAEATKLAEDYIAQAGTCEPELKTCRDNLRIQTDKANAIKNALTLGDVVEILWSKIRGIKIEK